jgi:hypothetical protein
MNDNNHNPMSSDIFYLTGRARSWYIQLCQQIIENHIEVPCRQGLAYEADRSLIAIFPARTDIYPALAVVDVPRKDDSERRIQFSVMYSLRRLLGYHDTVLFDKYPALRNYWPSMSSPFYARSIFYNRINVPDEFRTEPWVEHVNIEGHQTYSVDQFRRAVYILTTPETRQSKRCLIDFGEGYKARCVMSWLFLIRNDEMQAYQHMRSNDVIVGMPNNLIDIRVGQLLMAAVTGSYIGRCQHYTSLLQIYKRDISGLDCVRVAQKLIREASHEDYSLTVQRISKVQIIQELDQITSPYIGRRPRTADEGFARYNGIMSKLEDLFWSYNIECTPEHKACVEHLLGRYGKWHMASVINLTENQSR